jgi:hypothetical protein
MVVAEEPEAAYVARVNVVSGALAVENDFFGVGLQVLMLHDEGAALGVGLSHSNNSSPTQLLLNLVVYDCCDLVELGRTSENLLRNSISFCVVVVIDSVLANQPKLVQVDPTPEHHGLRNVN